jgi:hypothetical protein
MRGCLFTLLLGAVVIALVVVVGLPQVAAGMVTTAVTAAGLRADDTTVTVSSDPPTDLVGLHADRVRIRASDALFRGLAIGALDLQLGDVALLDRTVGTVSGSLKDVTVENLGGREVTLDAITLGGESGDITASTIVPGAQAERLIADAIEERTGVRPTNVTLRSPDRLEADVGVTVGGSLDVTVDGGVVLAVDDNPLGVESITLVEPGGDLPIRITDVRVTRDGDLRLDGDLSIGLLG